MKCPECGHINDWNRDRCAACGREIAYLRQRIFVGQQFVFFEASEAEPVAATLTPAGAAEGTESRFTRPTVVSRHEYRVDLGLLPDLEPGPRFFTRRRRPEPRPFDLPSLDFPRLDLLTVVTDRKIYRPEDEVHIFVVGPNAGGGEVELEVKLAGQRVYQTRAALDEAGLHLARFAELEEGEYRVQVRPPGRPEAAAECSFSCAEFTLSPLIATLESHTFEDNRLSFVLTLTQLSVPYDGPVELALRSGQRVTQKESGRARQGRLEASFDLEWSAWEALTIEVTTPEGNTAAVALPGTGWRERERITLSPLDPPVEASLLPFRAAEGEVRGLHYATGRERDTPFALEGVVAKKARVRARRDAELLQLLVFDPLSGEHQRHEYEDVTAGDVLSFEVGAPYALFCLGAFAGRALPYEAWGVAVRPVELEASLDVPEEAVPGATLSARLETDRPAECLLLVYDARLEHEDPLPRLAQRIYHQVRDASQPLGAGRVPEVLEAAKSQARDWRDYGPVLFAAAPAQGVEAMAFAEAPPGVGVLEEALFVPASPELALALLVAPRESFPELAFIELFPVDGRVDKLIQLGDQIGTWRCRAYFFRGRDYLSVTQDVRAALELYAELDLPALAGEADRVLAGARYHSQGPARLTITTPEGEHEHDVSGDGSVEFPLGAPGQVTAHIVSGDRVDTSQRTVEAPGMETVTASRLVLLQRGETIAGKRVVVYPSLGPLLQETVEALVRYPFG